MLNPKAEEMREIASGLVTLSDSVCGVCGTRLALYIGENTRQWDGVEAEWVESRKGETLPCHECARRSSVLEGEITKLRCQSRRCDSDRGKGDTLEAKNWLDTQVKVLEKMRAGLQAQADAWGLSLPVIYERMEARRVRLENRG